MLKRLPAEHCSNRDALACIVPTMTVRMKDIAKDLGVSIVTVSKALRNNPDIPEETRARVLKRVKELDYHPNMLAVAW